MKINELAIISATLLGLAAGPGCQDILGVGVGVPGEVGADGGVDAGEPDGGQADRCQGAIAQEDAWSCLLDVACGLIDECFGDTVQFEDCLAFDIELYGVSATVGEALMNAAIAGGSIEYDPAGFRQCLDLLSTFQCVDIFQRERDPFEQCAGFVGVVPDRGDCTFDRECAPVGSRCETFGCGDQVCCPGTCVAAAPLGGSCAQSSRPCEPGSFCDGNTCLDGRDGDRCTDSSQCDLDFWCDAGVCVPDHPTGFVGCFDDDACPYPETCVGLGLGQFLGVPTGVCGREFETGDACDGACGAISTHFCDQPDPLSLGTCTPVGQVGEACDPSQPFTCEIGLLCDETLAVCLPSGDVGQPCLRSGDCWPGFRFCSNEIDGAQMGTCSIARENGEACAINRHCASGVCQEGLCVSLDECEPVFPAVTR